MIAKLVSGFAALPWTVRTTRRVKGQLATGGIAALRPASTPPSRASGRVVRALLAGSRQSCLVEAAVRQAWHASRGDHRDLVIGVAGPAEGFKAHAWLEGDAPYHEQGFAEIARRRAA